jgi:hypothetical protein
MTLDASAEPLSSKAKSAHQETTLIALLITQFEASVVPRLILGSFYHAMGAGVYRLWDTNTQFWDIHLTPEFLRFNTTLTRRGPTRYNPASSTCLVHHGCGLAAGFLLTLFCSLASSGSWFRSFGLYGTSTPQVPSQVRRTKNQVGIGDRPDLQ